MRKRICLGLFCSLFMVFVLIRSSVLKDYHSNQIEETNLSLPAGNSVCLENSQGVYETADSFKIIFKYSIVSTIESYSYEYSGFTLVDHYKEDSRIIFLVKCQEQNHQPKFTINIDLDNQDCLTSTAHGYIENGLIAIDASSFVDAEGDLKYYEYKNGIISEKEYEDFKLKQFNSSNQKMTTVGGSSTNYTISLILTITFVFIFLILMGYIVIRIRKKKRKTI